MKINIKRYLKWFLIYTISYGLALAVFEYQDLNEIKVWKLVFRSILYGALMALLPLKSITKLFKGFRNRGKVAGLEKK